MTSGDSTPDFGTIREVPSDGASRWGRYLEPFLLFVCAVLFFRLCLSFAAGPLTWDELIYLDHSLNLDKDDWIRSHAWLFNRYGHVYAQAVFVHLAGDALTGARWFWCFLVTASVVLVYLCAKNLSRTRSRSVGIAAVALFLSFRVTFRYPGVTYAEVCLIACSLAALFVYLRIRDSRRENDRLRLVLFGVLTLVAIKSKELGICLLPLCLGFGFDRQQGAWSPRRFLGKNLFVGVGLAVAVIGFLVLDWTLVTGSFFSRTGSSVLPNLGRAPSVEVVSNTPIGVLGQQTYLFPFVLFVVSLFRPRSRDEEPGGKLVWAVPLGMILALTVLTYLFQRDTYERYLFPLIPFLAVCGASVLETRSAKWFLVGVPVTLLFVALDGYDRLAGREGWEPFYFANHVIYPAGALGVLLVFGFPNRWKRLAATSFGVCFWLTLYPALLNNYETCSARLAAQSSEDRFYPLKAFEGEIETPLDKKIFVSESIYEKTSRFGKEEGSCSMMFNIYRNANTSAEDFYHGSPTRFEENFDEFGGAFLHREDFEGFPESWRKGSGEELTPREGSRFRVHSEETETLVYLRRIEG